MVKTTHRALLFFFLCGLIPPLCADTYSGSQNDEAWIIRAPIWVFLEPQPGVMTDAEQKAKLPPRQAITEISKMVMAGMTYGWRFSYTPYDKKRNVPEEFTLEPLHTIESNDERLHITELRPQYPYLYCWAEYRITDAMAQRRKQWATSQYAAATGYGTAARKEETEGFFLAYERAAQSAVQNYLRKKVKNKPKHVVGEMLIKDNPRLYASNGEINTVLTVYIYIKEIVPYTIF